MALGAALAAGSWSAVLRPQIVRKRRGRLLARRIVLAQEAFDPEKPTRGPGEALRRLVTDGAIGGESLRRPLVPPRVFLRRGAAHQPRRRNAGRHPGDAPA